MTHDRRFEYLAALEDPLEFLEGLFAHSPVAFQIYRADGRSLLVNDKFIELFGIAPPPEYDVFRDQVLERQGFIELVRRAFVGEVVRVPAHWYDPGENRSIDTKGGKRIAIEVTLFPLHARSGSIDHVGVCVRDVTSEFQLTMSEARYRTQFEAAPEAIVTLDLETGSFVEANQNAVLLFGYPREELLAKNPLEVSPPLQPDGRASGEGIRDHIARTMRGERPVFEWTHLTALGAEIPCEIRLVRLPGEKENLCRASIIDISERKRLERQLQQTEEQLRQSQKMEAIGRLAGGVAHDFNNLLSVILGYSSLLIDGLDPASPVRADIESIRKAGERAAELTQQLLAFSRRQMLVPRVVSLDAVIHDAERILRRLLREDIELTIYSDPGLVRVRVDPGQIHQIIMNLAVNARDAMPEGGQLTLETRNAVVGDAAAERLELPPGRYVMLSVKDSGHGIDPATQTRIFEPFFTTKALGHGTGLGLSTVFGIVKQSGGGIAVQSELGRGTTFSIYFPEVTDATSRSGEFPAVVTSSGNETILVVEDQEDVRRVASEILTRQGYRVLEAQNGTEALLVSERYRDELDLVVTDVVMPHMSGVDLADRLRRRQPNLRVLYLSGYAEDNSMHQRLLDEATEFLQKPIVPQRLTARVRELLDKAKRATPASEAELAAPRVIE